MRECKNVSVPEWVPPAWIIDKIERGNRERRKRENENQIPVPSPLPPMPPPQDPP